MAENARTVRISLGRKLQVIKFEDMIDYGVTLEVKQEAGETDFNFKQRAATEAAALFQQVESAYVAAAMEDSGTPLSDLSIDVRPNEAASGRRAPPSR